MKNLNLLVVSLLVVSTSALQAGCCGVGCSDDATKAVKRALRSELARCAECGGEQEEMKVEDTKCNCGKPVDRKCSTCGKCCSTCSSCCTTCKDVPRRNVSEMSCDSCGGETEVTADDQETKCACGKPVNRKCSSCGKCCKTCSSCCTSC